MWNPFKWFGSSKDFEVDFNTLYQIYSYLVNEVSQITIKVKGQLETVEAIRYEIPCSFEQSEDDKKVLVERKLENYYQLLNEIYAHANISPIDMDAAQTEKLQYSFMQINFYTSPRNENEKLWFKMMKSTFYFIFVNEKPGDNPDSYRVYYKRGNDYSIRNFLDAKHILNLSMVEEAERDDIRRLEQNIVALAEYMSLRVSDKLSQKYPNSLLLGMPTLDDFCRIITLVNYYELDENVDEVARFLFEEYGKDWNTLTDEDGCSISKYFPRRAEVINWESNVWQSDWKFDPEDADYFIEEILGDEWGFEYPANTYSHDLFPYIQRALGKKGLELMSFDTEGDSYDFFLVHRKDVEEILELSNKLSLGIDKLA